MEFDFSKNPSLDNLEAVPEQFRGVYTQGTDGKFGINPSFTGITVAIDGLNVALRSERKNSTTLKGQKDIAAALKEHLGFDTVEDAKAKFEELTAAVASKANIDPAKLKADIEKGFLVKEEGYKADNIKMQGTLGRYMVDSAGLSALAEFKGNAKLLMPIIKTQAVVVADGDDYVVRIKDSAGDYRGNAAGGFMNVGDLVKELSTSTDYKIAFESTAPTGSGKQVGARPLVGRQALQSQQAAIDKADRTPAQLIADGLAARRRT